MRKVSDMLFLVITVMFWAQTEGRCSETIVSISGSDLVLRAGKPFDLSCKFGCLGPHHVAQMWRENGNKGKVSLLNLTSSHPDVTVVLSVSAATEVDTGYYSCMTQPPDTISPLVLIQITDNVPTSLPTTPSSLQCYSKSTQQQRNGAGLQGQTWFWILLGKTVTILFSLAALVLIYKRG